MKLRKLALTKKQMLVAGVTLLTVTVVLVVSLVGFGGTTLKQRALDNISEARFFMHQAENINLRVQFFSGVRETNYEIDGVATGTTPFALLNVEPRNISHIDDQELRGTLQIGDAAAVEVVLERNQYGRNFAIDLGKHVKPCCQIVFTLNLANDNVVFTLAPSMAEDAIGWEQALEIAVDNLADVLSAATSFETYVKIITDLQNLGAFWFVQFATNTGDTHFTVITPTGELIGQSEAA